MTAIPTSSGAARLGSALRSGGASHQRSAAHALLTQPAASQWRGIRDRFMQRRTARWGLYTLAAIVAACAVLPMLMHWGPNTIDTSTIHAMSPSMRHLLGTDTLGRDELARLLSAGRVSLTIGFLVAVICAAIGSLVGLVAGYIGGRVDHVLMTVVTALLTIPPLPLLAALSVLVESPQSRIGTLVRAVPESLRIVLVLTSLGWMATARVVRSQVMRVRNEPFVEASVAAGASRARTMVLHVLPTAFPSVVVLTTLGVSAAIMAESSLSFLGVGVTPPTATWGNMIADASNLLSLLRYPWLLWSPAAAIFLTILSVNFVGEGVRAAVSGKDPRA